MQNFKKIVIGCSSGGFNALKNILNPLPADFPAVILIVQHVIPKKPSPLPELFQNYCKLKVMEPIDGQLLTPNSVFIAPSDVHMVISTTRIFLERGPKVNFSRPAIDPLFYSAALNHGSNVIGIILSGTLDDGSAGLRAIKRCGGIAIIQDIKDAKYPEMPMNASQAVSIDYSIPSKLISSKLIQLTKSVTPITDNKKENELIEIEAELNGTSKHSEVNKLEKIATPSSYSCPDCNGVLWKIKDGKVERYRCRVGHAYSLASLETGLSLKAEEALWSALRALEEKEQLAKKIADKAEISTREHFVEKARNITEHIQIIRDILEKP